MYTSLGKLPIPPGKIIKEIISLTLEKDEKLRKKNTNKRAFGVKRDVKKRSINVKLK